MKHTFEVTVDLDDGQDPDGWADSLAMFLDSLDGGRVDGSVRHKTEHL